MGEPMRVLPALIAALVVGVLFSGPIIVAGNRWAERQARKLGMDRRPEVGRWAADPDLRPDAGQGAEAAP
jgi:hypothetical protein